MYCRGVRMCVECIYIDTRGQKEIKSAKVRARKKSAKKLGARKREKSRSAKARNLSPKKERERVPRERESVSAKTEKKRVPSSAKYILFRRKNVFFSNRTYFVAFLFKVQLYPGYNLVKSID
jgi:hypothetical protein